MHLSVRARKQLAQAWIEAVEAELAGVGEATVTLSALEGAMEAALRCTAAAALSTVLADAVGTGYEGPTRPCDCGGEQTTDHYVTCHPQTVLGRVTVRRAAYHCPTCGRDDCPLDARLGLPTAQTSARLAARLSLFCAVGSFAEACGLLAEATGVAVSPKRAQLVSEGLGAKLEATEATAPRPAPPDPVPRRLYLGLDGVLYCTTAQDEAGQLLWREAKVAVFYEARPARAPGSGRRSRLAPDGEPIDVAEATSQSYVGHLGEWREFATKLWREGQRRGLEQAREIIVLSDGAEWINALVAEVLSGLPGRVTHILDIRHAEEHLWTVARACRGSQALTWIQTPLNDLCHGRVDDLVTALQALPVPSEEAAKLVATTVAYYRERRAQMAYPAFRAQGLQIGSGLAESACKRLIGQRVKGAGMHWTVTGAQAIATLRAAYLSRRWHEVLALAEAG